MARIILFLSSIILFSCSSTVPNVKNSEQSTPLKYIALGDSYTIGEKVGETERFPAALTHKLREDGILIDDPKIIAVTGWTTDELMAAIHTENPDATWNLVSLLIGVNNQYRGYPFTQYEKEFSFLLDKAIKLANGKTDRVVVFSIPDYAFTPFGQTKDPQKITEELIAYNAYAKTLCKQHNILFLDITPFTQEGLKYPEYVAEDNLHPSGLMYKKWIDHYFVDIKNLIIK